MKPLASYRIVWVTERTDAKPSAMAHLRQGGADVQVCHPHVDLWVTLGAMQHDLIVLAVGEQGLSAAAVRSVRDQLAAEPRTRDVPVLCIAAGAAPGELMAAIRGKFPVLVWDDTIASEAIVEAVAEWVAPFRWASVLEERERGAREEARTHAARLEEARIELSDLSHDLRAFMNIIFGFSCNLRDQIHGELTGAQAEEVERILTASRDATGLIDRIKDAARPLAPAPTATSMSRASHRPPRVQRGLLDLHATAESVVRMFCDAALRKQLSIRLARRESIEVWGDALKIKQLLSNLVGNAIKYTPPGGHVDVEIRASRTSISTGVGARLGAEITVRDTGPGIAVEHRERIFERGVRLERDSHLAGKGFGLSIVRDVVAQHGGHVTVGDHGGVGTVVTVWIPTDRRARQAMQVLLAADSDATRALVLALRGGDAVQLRAIFPRLPEDFPRLSSGCDAAVLVAGGDVAELSAALDRLQPIEEPVCSEPSELHSQHFGVAKEIP